MNLTEALFGRTRPTPSRDEKLIALSSAAISLDAKLGLRPTGSAGIVIRPVASAAFERAEAELAGLLEIAGRETGSRITTRNDPYGYRWIVIGDDELADLVATAYTVSLDLRDAGFGDQVLAAAFAFRAPDGTRLHWLYNFKRATFYPFAPEADGERRDNARELQASAAMTGELPIEPDVTRWYPMWGMPLDG